MSAIVFQLAHSVEVDATPEFVWSFRTDVAKWSDPPARFFLDGPFEAGSRGTTVLPGQEPLHWRIREVRPGKAFVIEMPLDLAILSFEWHFDVLSGNRTKMTQRIVLSGDNAGQVEAGFGANVPAAMTRIAAEMATVPCPPSGTIW